MKKTGRYLELATDIRKFIGEKKLSGGDRLPSEKKLASILGANHITIRKALALLERDDLIYKIPSRGNFVGRKPAHINGKKLVGIIIPEKELFFYEILAELESRMDVFGYHPVFHISEGSVEKERKILRFFEKEAVDAVIAVPNRLCAGDYEHLKIPVFFFDVFIEGLDIPYVISDDVGGASRAVEHLISLGHRKIAHIGGRGDETSDRRLRGYTLTLDKHGIPWKECYVRSRDYSRQWGFRAMDELLKLENPPTAVFCGNDSLAAGAMRCINSLRLRCPDDISLAAFGNTAISEDLDITSITQSCPLIAASIWKNLKTALEGRRPEYETLIGTELIVRSSSAPPRRR